MLSVRVAKENTLAAFENDRIRHILHVRRRDYVLTVKARRRLHLTRVPSQFVQIRLRWLSHVLRRPDGELIRDLFFLSLLPRLWRKQA